jgi:hypothetical protein
MPEEVHVGDVGCTIQLTLMDGTSVVDVSSANVTKDIKLTDPGGNTATKAASFVTDGTDGAIDWTTTVVGDLDEAGTWKAQAYLSLTTWTGHSAVATFRVYPNLS